MQHWWSSTGAAPGSSLLGGAPQPVQYHRCAVQEHLYTQYNRCTGQLVVYTRCAARTLILSAAASTRRCAARTIRSCAARLHSTRIHKYILLPCTLYVPPLPSLYISPDTFRLQRVVGTLHYDSLDYGSRFRTLQVM